MKQTTKTLATMGGLALLALAIAFAAAWAGKDEETKAAAKEQGAKLISIDKAAARDLKIVKSGRLVVAVKRADEKSPWQVVAPVHAEADEVAVNALIDKLISLTQKAQVDGVDAKQVGVADEGTARLVVTLGDGANKSETLAFGDVNPFDQTIYVRKSGETALRLVAVTDRAALDKELIDLRDKRVFHVDDAAAISKLVVVPEGTILGSPLANAAGQFAFEVDRDGVAWKLVKPAAGLADSAVVDRMISSLKSLRAKDVGGDSNETAVLTQFGLSVPKFAVTATVNGVDGKVFERKLVVGQTAPLGQKIAIKHYAKRDDSTAIFEIDNPLTRELGPSLFELEDKSLLTLPRESVAKIEITSPGHPPIEIARTKPPLLDGGAGDETFTVTAPKSGPARKYKLAGILASFTRLMAAGNSEPKPADAKGLAKFGLDNPRTITLFDAGGAPLAKVSIGAESADKKHVYISIDGKPDIAQIDQSIASDLPTSVDDALEPPPAANGPPPALPPVAMPGMKKQ